MPRRPLAACLVSAALLCAALAPAVAVAQPAPPPAVRATDDASLVAECMSGVDVMRDGVPTCEIRDGKVTRHYQQPDPSAGFPGFGGWFMGVVFFALFWAALPMILAYGMASSSGQSVGLALLLTLALGWIGLLVVYLMTRPDVRQVAGRAVDNLTAPRAPSSPYATSSTPYAAPPRPAEGPEARLVRLERLRAAGSITEAEYAERRAEIVKAL